MNIINRIKSRLQSLPTHEEVDRVARLQRVINLENHILHDTQIGISNQRYCDRDIIVSLTSYGKRVWEVCLAIESIMQQTFLPNKIILNLDYSFQNSILPSSIQKQIDRGLEVRYCRDIRSYKKLIPTLKAHPSDVIITVDDDIIYDFNLLDRLYNSYMLYPDKIHAARTHVMTFNEDGSLKSYKDWNLRSADCKCNRHLFFTGGGGTLYPPGSLDEEVFNERIFTSICPTADDVWFNAMALKKGTEIVKVQTRNPLGEDYIEIESVQDIGLFHENMREKCLNDSQIAAVYSRYELYRLLSV